nr:phenylcoumaran benzylic ether reductase POP1-like [Ziziphus jujuba var. spinosa]
MAAKSKILVIGGTGHMGKFIVEASAKAGHETFALVREATLKNPTKANMINSFKKLGVKIVLGDLFDNESLVKALKQVDVVISTVGLEQYDHQLHIISAIKQVTNVKRFFPAEFGMDADRVHAVEPEESAFGSKAKIRRAIEASGIPYTYVCCNFFAGRFLHTMLQPGATAPPRDQLMVFGDGNLKGIFNKEEDVATYTIRTVDDPRTSNKILYIKPPANIYSFNELVSLWEKKIGKTLEKVYVPEDKLLENIQEASAPNDAILSIGHSVFVKGDQTNFVIQPSFGLEASELYPDIKYTTVDEYLNQFV